MTLERTHRMDAPDTRRLLDRTAQGVIGLPLDRPEGPLKVTGTATYAAEQSIENAHDLAHDLVHGLAHGVMVRATITKGRVTSIDKAAVEALPGVLAVIDDERLLRNPAQGTADEAPVQGPKEVAYLGQPIAVVVAESFEQARHGAQRLEVSYEIDDDAAIDPEAPDVTVDRPEKSQVDQGDLERAMREAEHTIDVVYRTPGETSAAMEPHASIAVWSSEDGADESDGADATLTLYGSYQMLKYNRNELADSLGIDPERVRILSPYVGGGFGSKLGIAPEAVAAALAARELGRPVKVVLSRRQVFEGTMRRSETRQRIRLAADAEGKLSGVGHESRVSNLPEETFSEPVAQSTHFLYAGQDRVVVHEVARVHQTCAGSVRAPGEAVGQLALECAMDELAHAAGVDPIELRLRNIPERHPEDDIPYSSRRLAEALEEGARLFGWERRQAQPAATREGDWWIGMGVAAAARPNILKASRARVTLHAEVADGVAATVETDMTDIGTGTYAILRQIAAEMLGLAPERVRVGLGDTSFPKAAGSGGSWGAGSSGSSVFLACEALRESLAERLKNDDPDWSLADGDEIVLKDGIATLDDRREAITTLLGGSDLAAEGEIEPGRASDARSQATYGAHFAEVAVHADSGEVRVRRMLGVFAAGRVLNEKTARSQCYGGMIWGIGQALTEELLVDPRTGHIVNHDLAEYHVPVNLDVPQLEVHLLHERDDWANPLQAKGIGEAGLVGAGAAVTNAIYNATGVRVRDYPATLDKIFPHLPD